MKFIFLQALLCLEFVYGIKSQLLSTPGMRDSWPDSVGEVSLQQIGLITPTGAACIPLLVKVTFVKNKTFCFKNRGKEYCMCIFFFIVVVFVAVLVNAAIVFTGKIFRSTQKNSSHRLRYFWSYSDATECFGKQLYRWISDKILDLYCRFGAPFNFYQTTRRRLRRLLYDVFRRFDYSFAGN